MFRMFNFPNTVCVFNAVREGARGCTLAPCDATFVSIDAETDPPIMPGVRTGMKVISFSPFLVILCTFLKPFQNEGDISD